MTLNRAGALAAALVLGAGLLGVCLLLAQSRPHLVASNSEVSASSAAITLVPGGQYCERGQYIPAAARSARLFLSTPGAPRSGPLELVVSGAGGGFSVRSPGGPAGALTLTLPPRHATFHPANTCVRNSGMLPVSFAGNLTSSHPQAPPASVPLGQPATDQIRLDFFGARRSWFAVAGQIAGRWSLFRPFGLPPSALWALLALALLAPAAALRASLASRAPSLRRSLLLCATLAATVGCAWSFITPPLQGPDEGAHAAYVSRLARSGSLPPTGATPAGQNSLPGYLALLDRGLPFNVEAAPTWDPLRAGQLRQLQKRAPDSAGSGASGVAGNPPLYYLLAAPLALVGRGLPGADQLQLMRLVSVLLGALTAALVVLFLQESFPAHPRAWLFGGLAVAMQPVFSFMSGVVSVDNLLFATSAGLLMAVARLLHRGLTQGNALLLAAFALAGVLTKSTAYFLLPGAVLALAAALAAAWRTARRPHALRAALLGGGALALGIAIWLEANGRLLERASTVTHGYGAGATRDSSSLRGLLSYSWQFFLPRLPFMRDQFAVYPRHPLWDVYFRGLVGRFGAFQFDFPTWVDQLALALLLVVLALAGAALVQRRSAAVLLRLGVYAATALGLLALVAYAGYTYRQRTGYPFEQTRYLFPLLALYGALFAAALLALPRRLRAAAGGGVLALLAVHNFGGLLLTLGRYYG